MFHLVNEETNADNFTAKAFSACISGLCTIATGIIMYNNAGKFWAAVTVDANHGKSDIHYYTNDAKWIGKLLVTIENWRRSLQEPDAPVVYRNKRANK